MAKILILDNGPAGDRLLRQLALMGHTVVALQADAYSAQGLAARERADLIMMAVNLAGGGGAQVLPRVRADALTARTPVIILFGDSDTTDGILLDSYTRLLQKPTDFDTMKLLFNELLSRPSPEAKPRAAPEPEPDADAFGGLAPLGPPPQSGRSVPMDMGAPSDDDLPPGETIEL